MTKAEYKATPPYLALLLKPLKKSWIEICHFGNELAPTAPLFHTSGKAAMKFSILITCIIKIIIADMKQTCKQFIFVMIDKALVRPVCLKTSLA